MKTQSTSTVVLENIEKKENQVLSNDSSKTKEYDQI